MDILLEVNRTMLNGVLYAGIDDNMSSTASAIPSFEQPSSAYPNCQYGSQNFNCTVEQYLTYARGPQQLPLTTTLLVSIQRFIDDYPLLNLRSPCAVYSFISVHSYLYANNHHHHQHFIALKQWCDDISSISTANHPSVCLYIAIVV